MPVNFGKIFKIQMHAGEFQRIFQTKVSTYTDDACIYACKLWKIFQNTDARR
jgi:hypothetical protein